MLLLAILVAAAIDTKQTRDDVLGALDVVVPYIAENTMYALSLGYRREEFLKMERKDSGEYIRVVLADQKVAKIGPWAPPGGGASKAASVAITELSSADRLLLPCEIVVRQMDGEWVFSYSPAPNRGVDLYISRDFQTVAFSDDP